jgi:protease-4
VVFPAEALDLGLVDKIGTFEEAKDAAPEAERRGPSADVAAMLGSLHGNLVWSAEEWGEPARIALLYAIGVCDMDTGIRGRELSKAIREAREDRRIRAVVLRVDSPGGDPLPSDLVARELRETAKKKPVIISQGQVAASGGYWISMYGDEILVSPFTVTGSIGVILAHVWDDSLGARIGWDYDGISRGRSSDLQRGPEVPFVGSIPHRPMTPDERARAELLIRQLYGDFVSRVAEGREMDESTVDAVGQGRVWSGRAGIANGLADRVGGLWDALALAKDRAGIADRYSVEIKEGPGLGYFRPDLIVPKLLGVRAPEVPTVGSPSSWVSSLARVVRPAPEGASASADGGQAPLEGLVFARRLGFGLWSQLPLAEQRHLQFLGTHLGSPLVLSPPILIDGSGGEGP